MAIELPSNLFLENYNITHSSYVGGISLSIIGEETDGFKYLFVENYH